MPSNDPPEPSSDMPTDAEWEKWGRQEPYFGVITNPKFRLANLDEYSRREFFESGRWHVQYVFDICRRHLDPGFAPASALHFGCGVGRVLVPLAQCTEEVVGVDVSPSMLREARRNCDRYGVGNVRTYPPLGEGIGTAPGSL